MIHDENITKGLWVLASLGATYSFSKTANLLKISQATVSKKISNLEKKLGPQLVKRSTRGVKLTSTAHKLIRHYDEVESNFSTYIDNISTQDKAKKLRISMPNVFANEIVMPHVAKFLQENPEINLEIFMYQGKVDLVSNAYDIAILNHYPDQQTIKISKLCKVQFGLYCTPMYVEKYGLISKCSELKSHLYVGGILHDLTAHKAHHALTPDGDVVTVENTARLSISHSLVASTLGASNECMFHSTISAMQDQVKSGAVIHLLPQYTFGDLDFYMVRLDNIVGEQLSKVLSFIKSCAKNFEQTQIKTV